MPVSVTLMLPVGNAILVAVDGDVWESVVRIVQ